MQIICSVSINLTGYLLHASYVCTFVRHSFYALTINTGRVLFNRAAKMKSAAKILAVPQNKTLEEQSTHIYLVAHQLQDCQ
jgi:hypothetical protein